MSENKQAKTEELIDLIKRAGQIIIEHKKSTKTQLKKELKISHKRIKILFEDLLEFGVIETKKGGGYQPKIESNEELEEILDKICGTDTNESSDQENDDQDNADDIEQEIDESNSEETDESMTKPVKKGGFLKVFFILSIIGVGAYFVYQYLTKPEPAVITFVYNSKLEDREPGKSRIYFSDHKSTLGTEMKSTNSNGFVSFIYRDGFVGDTVFINFRKQGYVSQSNYNFIISEQVMIAEKNIRFKKYVPPPPPDPTYSVNFKFHNKSGGIALIHLDGDTIGRIQNNQTFTFKKQYKKSDAKRLSFLVTDDSTELKTSPPSPVYNVNRSVSGNIEIYAELENTPVIIYTILETDSRIPLEGVEVKFSDSKTPVISDENGLVTYKIDQRVVGKTVFANLNQNFVHLKDASPSYLLSEALPDTILSTLYCSVDFTIRIIVQDINENMLPGTVVNMEGNKKLTNESGVAEFQVSTMDKMYGFDIDKDKYDGISIRVKPLNFITTEMVNLAGTYGTIIVVDSLEEKKPVPYVNIKENGINIGQTGQDGSSKINVLIAKSMELKFEPSQTSDYLPKKQVLNFTRLNDIKKVYLSPKPYVFTVHVTDDQGRNLKGVTIRYGGATYTTDKRGKVVIVRYIIAPEPEERFYASHFKFKQEYVLHTDPNERVYTINFVKASKISIKVESNPRGANITVYNLTRDKVAEGRAPLDLELDLGSYNIVATNNKGQSAEDIFEIDGPRDQPIVLDMINPVTQIIDNYNKREYGKVITIYDRHQERVKNLLNNHEQYSRRKCEVLEYIAKSYDREDQEEKSIGVWRTLVDECAKPDPLFYRSYADLLYNNRSWVEADQYYQKSLLYLARIPGDIRVTFNVDCLFARAQVQFNNYMENRSDPDFSRSKCYYISGIERIIRDIKEVVNANNLDYPAGIITNIESSLREDKQDCP